MINPATNAVYEDAIGRLVELDSLYYEKDDEYNEAKSALEERQSAANEKAYSRTQAEQAKSTAALEEAKM
jgi:hypothetical protein